MKIQKRTEQTKDSNIDLTFLRRDFNFKRFTTSNKINFYRDLSISISSGADIATAVQYLRENSNSSVNRVIDTIYQSLLRGESLSNSLSLTRKFTEFELVSITIGENTGRLPEILDSLSSTFERDRDLKRQIISISSYPLLLMVLTFGVLVFMLYFVVPTFEDLYNRFDAELPKLTQVVLYLSSLFNTYTILGFLFLFGIGTALTLYYRHTLFLRKAQFHLINSLPYVNTLYKESVLARYFGYFAMMISAGITVDIALNFLHEMTSIYPLRENTLKMKYSIEAGMTISASMNALKYFDPHTVSLIRIGEDSNALNLVFANLSNQYSKKSEFSLKTFGSLIEPLLIVFIAVIVAVILLAMYLPIFKFSTDV